MADVTKDLLLKISTTGDDEAVDSIHKTTNAVDSMLNKTIGLNQAWELFNKVLGVAKAGMTFAAETFSGMVDISADFEQMGVRFEAIFGGSGPAQKALDWAVKFGAQTPLSLAEVQDRMIKLKTFGFDPMDGALAKIGDTAFTLGSDFDGIVMALGRMSLTGKVSAETINMLTERNIPAVKWLGEEFNLSSKQLANIGNAGLDADKVVSFLIDKMGKEFAGGMQKASDTWKGAMSTIEDVWTIFKKNIMDSGPFEFLVENIKSVRDAFSTWADSSQGMALASATGEVISKQLVFWKGVLINDILPNTGKIGEVLLDWVKSFSVVWNFLVDIAGIVSAPLLILVNGIASAVSFMSDGLDTIERSLKVIFIEFISNGLSKVGQLGIALEKAWAGFRFSAEKAFVFVEQKIGDLLGILTGPSFSDVLITAFRMKPEAISVLNKLGEDLRSDASKRDQALTDSIQSTADTIQLHSDLWESFVDTTKADLYSWSGTLDLLKMNVSDPLGLKGLMGATSGKSGKNSTPTEAMPESASVASFDVVAGLDPESIRKILYGSGKDAPTLAELQQKRAANEVQLIAPPGDDLLTIIIKYINKSIRAEGTIGAGF